MTREEAEAALRVYGSQRKAAVALGVARETLQRALMAPPSPIEAPAVPAEPSVEKLGREHRLMRENERLKAENRALLDARSEEGEYADFVRGIVEAPRERPEWLVDTSGSGLDSPGVAMASISDGHTGEAVNPVEVEYCNGYDLSIAKERTQRAFANIVKLAEEHVSGVRWQGIVINLLGDNISGEIHDELRETNEAAAAEAVLVAADQLSLGLGLLADVFPFVHVVATPGNHSRLQKKPQAKGKGRKNLDWLIYQLVARDFRSNDRVSFDIAEGPDVTYQVYHTRFLATHGDQFRGGSGIAGALSPMMLGDARKRKRAQAIRRPYDWLLMGHWHQLFLGVKGMIVNGSIKGYDEYAYNSNFEFEPPQQAFWVCDPRHGVTLRAPIHVLGDDEPWMTERRQEVTRASFPWEAAA